MRSEVFTVTLATATGAVVPLKKHPEASIIVRNLGFAEAISASPQSTADDSLFAMLVLVMRLFVALDLAAEIRARIRQFMEQMRPLAPAVRWVGAESLHVTLKFIGELPDANVKDVEAALGRIAGAEFNVAVCGCGFFPTAKSARVFWVGIEAGPELRQLARDIEMALEPLGIERDNRSYSPHLTLARAGGGSGVPSRQRGDRPNRTFSRVQERLGHATAPDFGTMTACEFFLYRSQLSSQGAKYSKLARFPLEKA